MWGRGCGGDGKQLSMIGDEKRLCMVGGGKWLSMIGDGKRLCIPATDALKCGPYEGAKAREAGYGRKIGFGKKSFM